MDRKELFEFIESALRTVLESMRMRIMQEDIEAVEEFLGVGEYGLAYERLIDSIPQDADDSIKIKLQSVGELMGLR
jgi:predicted DNA binding CopG/RHH family protein